MQPHSHKEEHFLATRMSLKHSLLSVWQGSTVKNIIFGLKQGSKCSGMDGSDLVKSLLTRLSREIMHSDQSSKFGQKY